MAMSLSSCMTTLLSHRALATTPRPRPTPTPVKSSPGAGSLHLCSGQPAAAVEALRWASSCEESRSRAGLFACHALNKYSYHIEPTALLYRTPSAPTGPNWKLTDEKDFFILELEVGDLTQDKLNVSTRDHVLLVAKYTGDINDEPRASSLDVRLLMPPGYDEKNVQAMMGSKGWLKITIPKPKHEPSTIDISPSTET